MSETITGYAQAAPLYLAAGFEPFPLDAGKKDPPPPGATGYNGIINAEKVAQWCTHRPGDNLALRPSAWLVGIDIDGREHGEGKTGPASIAAFEAQHGELPATAYSTRHGAAASTRIAWYEIPEGVRLTEKPLSCVELIQRHHRFGVVFPSVLDDGTEYRWYNAEGNPILIPQRSDIERLPDEWVIALTAPDRVPGSFATSGEVTEWLERLRDGSPSFQLRARVTSATDIGNTLLLAHVGAGVRACTDAVGGREAFDLLVEHLREPYVAKYGTKKFTTDLGRALQRVIGDLNKSRADDQNGAAAMPDDANPTDDPNGYPTADAPGDDYDELPLYDLVAILDANRPPRIWLLDHVVPAGDHTSITAKAGTGKSLFVLALAIALCRGDFTFIGLVLTPPKRVFYIDVENSDDDWNERLTDLGVTQDEMRALLGTRFFPLSFPDLAGLDTEAGAQKLLRWLDHHGAERGDLLVMDSHQRVTQGEENSNDVMRELYRHTTGPLKRLGITVIRTDNSGHMGERARGASGKGDDVAMAWFITQDARDEEVFSLTENKRRGRKHDGDGVAYRRANSDGRLVFEPVAKTEKTPDRADPRRRTWYMEQVSRAVENKPGVSAAGIEREVGKRAEYVRAARDVLLDEGFLRSDGGETKGGARKFFSLAVYRQVNDPLSDEATSSTSSIPRPYLVQDDPSSTSSTSSPRYVVAGTRDEVDAGADELTSSIDEDRCCVHGVTLGGRCSRCGGKAALLAIIGEQS